MPRTHEDGADVEIRVSTEGFELTSGDLAMTIRPERVVANNVNAKPDELALVITKMIGAAISDGVLRFHFTAPRAKAARS